MTRYLLRNGKCINVDANPSRLDVLIYTDRKGQTICAVLSEKCERDLLSI